MCDHQSVEDVNVASGSGKALTIGYPCIVMLQVPGNEIKPLGGLTTAEGIRTKFNVHCDTAYKSYSEIRLLLPNQPHTDDESQDKDIIARIRFPAKALKTDGLSSTRAVTESDDVPECVRNMPKVAASIQSSAFFCITIRCDPAHIIWIGCRADYPGLAPTHKAELKALIAHIETAPLTLYCRASPGFPDEISELKVTLGMEFDTGDPIMQWHKAHPKRAFVQQGMLDLVEDRPIIRLPMQVAFSDFAEYLTIHGYGAVQEGEHCKDKVIALGKDTHRLRLLTIPGAENRRYLGLLKLTSGHEGLLRPGDSIKINFNPDIGTDDDDWTATVTEALLVASGSTTTIILNRPRNKEDQTKFVEQEVQAKSGLVNTLDDLRKNLGSGPVNIVRVTAQYSEKTLRRQLNSLKRVTDGLPTATWMRHLLGQDLIPRSSIDLYEGMPSITPPKGFSASQLRLHEYCRRLPDGVGIVTGPPGTGKTHAIVSLIIPLLRAPEGRRQILVATPSNEPADVVAMAIQRRIDEEPGLGGRIVIRYHSSETERDIIWQHSRRHQQERDIPNILIIDETLITPELAAMEAAMLLKTHYSKSTARSSEYSNDPRVNLLQQSLGLWMLRVSGVEPGYELDQNEDWHNFRSLYELYTEGSLTDGKDKDNVIAFNAAICKLHAFVISRADVIVTTLSNCADQTLLESLDAGVVFIDEAAKATELDTGNVTSNYNPRVLLLVGDDRQLRPTVLTTNNPSNGFAPQLSLSLFERLKSAGKPSILLREQFRMATGLSRIPSKIFYAGRLIDDPSTLTTLRPNAVKWQSFLEKHYKIRGSKMFLNVHDSVCIRNPQTSSRANVHNATAVIGLLKLAFADGIEGRDVAIAVPYQAQYEVYRNALTQLKSQNAPFGEVDVRKIDGYQGGEASLVILDMVITDQAGFVGEWHRINVGMTRCRDGLVVVGEVGASRRIDRRRVLHYREVINEYYRDRAVFTVEAADLEQDSMLTDCYGF